MNDNFEKRLQQIAPRKIPSAWREEILTTAQQAQTTRPPTPAARPSFLATLIYQFSTLAHPQRAAWSGLAATWFVIIALNIAARENTRGTEVLQTAAPVSSDTLQALKQQRLLLVELVGRPDRPQADRPKAIAPGPRSQRREESATA